MLRLKGNGISGNRVSGRVLKIPAVSDALPADSGGSVLVLYGDCDAASVRRLLSMFLHNRAEGYAFIICGQGVDSAGISPSSEITAVSGFDHELFLNGDSVSVNPEEGIVEIENAVERRVVNCVVKAKNTILILKRSERVGSFQGKWSSVTGYVEEGENPVQSAFKEVREEISVPSPALLRQGRPVYTRKGCTVWISYPFLFSIEESTEIRIDWEHTDYRWVTPGELENYDTVPGLSRNLSALGIESGKQP
jgi:8-oxo-dGTP pyrophosphatase MutT (NUDIX family)